MQTSSGVEYCETWDKTWPVKNEEIVTYGRKENAYDIKCVQNKMHDMWKSFLEDITHQNIKFYPCQVASHFLNNHIITQSTCNAAVTGICTNSLDKEINNLVNLYLNI